MPKIVDHDAKRAEITSQLAPLVTNGSIAAMGLREMAKHVGISLGAFSHYFKTKDELLESLFKMYSQNTLALLHQNIDLTLSPQKRILRSIELILQNEEACLVEVLLLVDQARARTSLQRRRRAKSYRFEQVYVDELAKIFGIDHARCRYLLTYIVGLLVRRQWTEPDEDMKKQNELLLAAMF
jgi:AcrR family transcriptional regulator